MPTDLILIRHGQAVRDLGKGPMGWWADLPLSQTGQRQAILLAERLRAEYPLQALYVSPLTRTWETGDVIRRVTPCNPIPEPGLMELDGGDLVGLTTEEARRKFPDLMGRPLEFHERYPGGESYSTLHTRVTRTLTRIVNDHAGATVAAVTHGGPLNLYLRTLLGHGAEDQMLQFECSECSLHHLRFGEDGDRTIVALNDTAHLRNMPRPVGRKTG